MQDLTKIHYQARWQQAVGRIKEAIRDRRVREEPATELYYELGRIYTDFSWYFPDKEQAYQKAVLSLEKSYQAAQKQPGNVASTLQSDILVLIIGLYARAGRIKNCIKIYHKYRRQYDPHSGSISLEKNLQVALALWQCLMRAGASFSTKEQAWLQEQIIQNSSGLKSSSIPGLLAGIISLARRNVSHEELLRALLLNADLMQSSSAPLKLKQGTLREIVMRATKIDHRPALIYLKQHYPDILNQT